MKNLSKFLDRFKKIGLPDETIRKEAVAVIQKVVGEGLDLADVTVKDGTLYINSDSVLKNELFMKKKRILNELSLRLGEKSPKNMR